MKFYALLLILICSILIIILLNIAEKRAIYVYKSSILTFFFNLGVSTTFSANKLSNLYTCCSEEVICIIYFKKDDGIPLLSPITDVSMENLLRKILSLEVEMHCHSIYLNYLPMINIENSAKNIFLIGLSKSYSSK